jgi:predicted MPP superfamily phosphohydrolase
VAARVTFVLLVLTCLCLAYGFLIEPTWLKVRHVTLSKHPTVRVIFFTDLHYKGDRKYLKKVVATINRLPGDVVCFGGDLIEAAGFIEEAWAELRTLNKPVYGVPGNHDYWSGIHFQKVADEFKEMGGEWLCDTHGVVKGGTVEIVGRTGMDTGIPVAPGNAIKKRILLVHYPDWTNRVDDRPYDVILAGHNHGGQVCLPWLGPVLTWIDGENYQSGFSKTPAGPLYVSSGVGTYLLPVRFFCRPEIVVVEL